MLRHRRTRLFLVATASLLASALTACSPVAFLNSVEPRFGVHATRDLAYADGPRRTLDVYVPRRPRAGRPVVVFVYGGGWDSGEKASYAFVGETLAAHGYLVVIPDYRIFPEVHYPEFLQDCAKAVRWTYDHAADYGGDPRSLFLMGHSAGAYNVAMLGLDPEWLAGVGLTPHDNIRGVVGLAGPYDFLPLQSDELKSIFGDVGQRPQSQPITYVSPQEPPMFLAHDLGDKIVYPANTDHLSARIRTAGGQVEAHYYKGLSHALMIGVFAAPLRFLAPVRADVTAFIDRLTPIPRTPS